MVMASTVGFWLGLLGFFLLFCMYTLRLSAFGLAGSPNYVPPSFMRATQFLGNLPSPLPWNGL